MVGFHLGLGVLVAVLLVFAVLGLPAAAYVAWRDARRRASWPNG